ncbi:MAG: bifunctional folylpolyglutamate synthase/dihydrofolate synthase, partial [Veillonella caviae]|nr:bifunctional folylpolyglutamate synthase/dihydrofolate synthase [Veillonella caviae]
MTYEEALTYLESTSSFGIKPGLDRIKALMTALDHPEEAYKIVHVAGTNGKGSVTTYISYALFTSGLRVGRFISPHLESYTERIQINDAQISEAAFGELIGKIKSAVDTCVAKGIEAPTQFEILTAA